MSKAMKIIDKSHISQFGEHQNQGPLVQRYTLRAYFATIALSIKNSNDDIDNWGREQRSKEES